MTIYTGRAKLRTGMSRNKRGLKMSGSSSKVGRPVSNKRVISKRVRSNLKPCGTIVNRSGKIVGFRGKNCRKKKFSKVAEALDTIFTYFQKNRPGQHPILVGKNETLVSDLGQDVIDDFNSQAYCMDFGGPIHPNNERHTEAIKHYHKGTADFDTLPSDIQSAVQIINDLKLKGKLKKDGPFVEHVIGSATMLDMKLLHLHGYGVQVAVAKDYPPIMMFMSSECWTNLGILLGSIAATGGSLYAVFLGITGACVAVSAWSVFGAFALATACEMAAMAIELSAAGGAIIAGYQGGEYLIDNHCL